MNRKLRHGLLRFKFVLVAGCFLFGVCSTAIGQDSIQWTTNYYAVSGASLREIQQSLRQARPWKNSDHDGLTRWRVDWRVSVAEYSGRCRLSSFSTRTTVTITLPRWTGPTNTPDSVRQEWQRYAESLGQHEAGHGQFAVTAAAEMRKQVRAVSEMANCDALKQHINSLCQGIMEDYKRREREYDERTQHGATQGARLFRRRETQ